MNKHIRRALVIIPLTELVLSAVLLVVSFFIDDIPAKVTHIYREGEIVTRSWHNVFENITSGLLATVIILNVACIITCIVVKIRHKEEIGGKVRLALLTGIVCPIMLFFSDITVCGLWSDEDYGPQCYEFSDGIHTIVIKEESFLLYGGGTVYQIMDDNKAVAIHDFTTDDGGRNYGKYDIRWHGDFIELTYRTFSSEDSRCTEKIWFTDDE